jgi:DNA replication protein DnaC
MRTWPASSEAVKPPGKGARARTASATQRIRALLKSIPPTFVLPTCEGAGYSVLFRSAASVLEELQRQGPESRRSKLRTYANTALVCIDEVGYLSFDDKAADLLYEIINRRYERKPLIVTTNRPFKEWNEVFPNATCIITLLDRLLHHADVTVIEGDSYRVRESEEETAARRKRK